MADAKCTTVEVAEDRGAPDGRKIGLAVVVAPATSRARAADPLFLIAGGPGQGAADVAPYLLHKLDSLRADRDLVFVDVRGTGGSAPLRCELEDPDDLAAALADELDLSVLDGCLADYEAGGGVALEHYNTDAIVDDLDEVRAALGYEQINLLAISYGTAVAQVYMRRHGERLRAVVLDGVVPLDRSVGLEQPRNTEAALLRVLADCREQAACAEAFPGLERKLDEVLRELDENRVLERFDHPRMGKPMAADITRAGLLGSLTAALYVPGFTALVPLMIEQAHAGDYGPVAALTLHMRSKPQGISMGVFLSVACAEGFAGVRDEAARREAVDGLRYFDDSGLEWMARACAAWPHRTSPPEFAEAVRSEVPTLVFSGGYDHVTPAVLGEHVAAQLRRARHVEAANGAHGLWNRGCAQELMREFFVSADPDALDVSCLDALERPPFFLNAGGPWPLVDLDAALFAQELYP